MATKKSYEDSELLEIGDELDENGQRAENILQAIVTENRKPRYEEAQWLKLRCGWSDANVVTQISRIHRVLRNQRIAGTVDDRAAMRTESDKAAEVLSSEGTKIATQIEVLQSKLSGLERASRLAEKRLSEMDEAVTQLRVEAPPHCTNEHASKMAHLGQSIGNECLAAESDLAFLENMLAIDTGSPNAIDVIRVHYPLVVQIDSFRRHTINGQAWNAQRSELTAQLKKLRPRALELRKEYDALRAGIDSLLDYYIE